MNLITHSDEETMRWAKEWAKKELHAGDVLCLRGDLGAGKTHFVKGLVQAFGIESNEVNSPTFTLIHEYRKGTIPFFHFDCYRFKHPSEALEIGIEEYLYGEGICCIEWPERIEELLPAERIEITISHSKEDERMIEVVKFGQQ